MSELDQYARQMIPSARLLEEGSITMASMAPVDISDLEKKKIEILSDTYCNELQNDMAVYKHFRQGHMDGLRRSSSASRSAKTTTGMEPWLWVHGLLSLPGCLLY